MANNQLSSIFKSFLRRVFHTEWTKLHYLVLNINPQEWLHKKSEVDAFVKELSYEDFLLGDVKQFTQEKLDSIKKRFDTNEYKAYGIIKDGKLVYSAWISLKNLDLPIATTPIYLNNNEGYLEDAYCDPSARGQGLHNLMNNYRVKKLAEHGKDTIIVIVIDGNIPALKTQKNTGFIDMGTFYVGRIFGKKFVTLNKDKYES